MTLKLLIAFQLIITTAYSQTESTSAIPNQIKEAKFISINGIEQWVTLSGDKTKPVILFIHGGPGSPISPYSEIVYGAWEKDFIIVQWDQRGTGKTYGKHAPKELSPGYLKLNLLTVDQMTDDGIEVSKYLINRLGKQKIILFGTSWGSILGAKMALKNPELFYAYIGHSQIVNPSLTSISAYKKVFQMAQAAKDQQTIDELNLIGKPPYETAKSVGQLIRLTKKYQQINTIKAPASWFALAPEYDNEKDNQDRSDGDDYSFVNYAGDKKFGIPSMISKIDFMNDGLVFKIPVYFIQGKEDIQTPEEVTRAYFDKINAPKKKLILLPKTDHGFNQSVIDAQYKIMKKYLHL